MGEEKKINVYSETLGRAVPVKKTGNLYIIPHSFLNKAAAEKPVECNFQVVSSELNHAVVLCCLTADGVRIDTIGETTEGTLWTKADREYPVTVAWNRAFDRAMIRYLAFDKPVFSDKELNPKEEVERTRQKESENHDAESRAEEQSAPPAMAAEKTKPVETRKIEQYVCREGYADSPAKTEKKAGTETEARGEIRDPAPRGQPGTTQRPAYRPQYKEPAAIAPGIMQIGPCKGKPIEAAKSTKAYSEFVKFAKTAGIHYENPEMQKQLTDMLGT